MASTYKRLGALASTGTITTADTLYTCPSATSAVVNVDVCNRDTTSHAYRICVHTAAAFADAGYRVFGATVPANDTVRLGPYVLDATNKHLMCSADSANVSFTADGVENT